MRSALMLVVAILALGGCPEKKPAARHGGQVENKHGDLDKDKDERNGDSRDDKDDVDPKRGGDPCEGGE